jgi:arylsulfatase A-like enzyme
LVFVLLLSATAIQAVDVPKDAAKPNIVYLLADEWRASATGYAGDPNVKTPNLDRLAKEGLLFRNAVSVCPVCTPYRASLMTGRYPTSTGMFLNDAHLPDEEVCMAETLSAAGYATGYIGKWHLDGHGRGSYIPPERRQGWDYWKAAECDHSYNHSHYYTGTSDAKQFWEGYDAFAETKDAQAYIREHAKGTKPFALLVSYGTPHFPHGTAPAEYKALYPPEKIQLPPNVPEALQAKARQEAQGYYAHCTALDKCVGDVLKTLDEAGIADRTIVVFTSDHGETLGSHGCPPCNKQVAWSESSNVPFMLRYPAIHGKEGRVVRTPLTTPDILPTLLGLAGVAVPQTVEGEDLSALLREGREVENRVALYMGVSPFLGPREFAREYRAIRTTQYTYVRDLKGPWLLFDDAKDPNQLDNLAAKPECAALCKELDGRLQEQLKKIGDDFRPGKSYIEEWGYQVAPHGSVGYAEKEIKVQTPKRKTAGR